MGILLLHLVCDVIEYIVSIIGNNGTIIRIFLCIFCGFINVSEFTDLLFFIDSHGIMCFWDIYFCLFKDSENNHFIHICPCTLHC